MTTKISQNAVLELVENATMCLSIARFNKQFLYKFSTRQRYPGITLVYVVNQVRENGQISIKTEFIGHVMRGQTFRYSIKSRLSCDNPAVVAFDFCTYHLRQGRKFASLDNGGSVEFYEFCITELLP